MHASLFIVAVAALAQVAPDPPCHELEDEFIAAIDQERLVTTVRELVALGARMGGTPSGDAAARWHARRFEATGLVPVTNVDPELRAFQPLELAARIRVADVAIELGDGALALHTPGFERATLPLRLELPASAGEAPSGAYAVLLESPSRGEPGPTAAGRTRPLLERVESLPRAARPRVLLIAFDQRVDSSTPVLHQPRGFEGTVLTISRREHERLRAALAAAPEVEPALTLAAKVFDGPGRPLTVAADLPASDPDAPILLFCAHGDSDAGSLGADDNASGNAVVHELATVFAALARGGLRLPMTLRFVQWGSEIHSTRDYVERIREDGSAARHLAVINFDQAGTGAERECIYFEPDDWEVNEPLVRIGLAVAGEHVGKDGFWKEYTSNAALGGTDSYVFGQNDGERGDVPALTIFTAAFGEPERPRRTPGFPHRFEDAGGRVFIDYSRVYHETGDRPEHTIELEPYDMKWTATAAGLLALRLAATPAQVKRLLDR